MDRSARERSVTYLGTNPSRSKALEIGSTGGASAHALARSFDAAETVHGTGCHRIFEAVSTPRAGAEIRQPLKSRGFGPSKTAWPACKHFPEPRHVTLLF